MRTSACKQWQPGAERYILPLYMQSAVSEQDTALICSDGDDTTAVAHAAILVFTSSSRC